MAKSLGELYVTLSVKNADWSDKLKEAADEIEGMASKAAASLGDISDGFLTVSAAAAGFVIAASSSSLVVTREVNKLKTAFQLFAEEVGEALLPAVKTLNHVVQAGVAAMRKLDAGQREALVSVVLWSAGLGTGLKVLERSIVFTKGFFEATVVLAPALGKAKDALLRFNVAMTTMKVGDFAKEMKGATTTFAKDLPASIGRAAMTMGAVLLPILAVSAAIAGVALLAGSLYRNWGDLKLIATEAASAMTEGLANVFAALGELGSKMGGVLSMAFGALSGLLEDQVEKVLKFVAFLVSKSAAILRPVAKAAGMTTTAAALKEAEGLTGEKLFKGLKEILKSGASKVVDSLTPLLESAEAAVAGAKERVAGAASWYVGKAKEGLGQAAGDVKQSFAGLKQMLMDMGLGNIVGVLERMLDQRVHIEVVDHGKELSKAQLVSDESNATKTEAELAKWADEKNASTSFERMEQERAALYEEERRNLEMRWEDEEDLKRARIAEHEAAASSIMEMVELQRAIEAEAKAARSSLVSSLRNSIGKINSLIDAFERGTEASGSAWGGLAAVVATLLTESKGWLDLINMVTNMVQRVADGLGELLVPMEPLIGALAYILDVVVGALQPLLKQVGETLGMLAPPLVIIGRLLEGLAPLLEALAAPISYTEDALKVLFDVLKFVSIVILTVVKMISEVWNAIISAVQWVIRGISKAVEWLGIDSLKKFAKSMDKMKVNTNRMDESLRNLSDTTWESADAQARQTAEVLKSTDAMEKMNEALTNVPTAWKVALRRFESQDAQDGQNPNGRPPGDGSHGGDGGPVREPTARERWLEGLPGYVRDRVDDGPSDAGPGGKGVSREYIPKTSGGRQMKSSQDGITNIYNFDITGLGTEEAAKLASRTIERAERLKKLATAGKLTPMTPRYAGGGT